MREQISVPIVLDADELVPTYASESAAGMDLKANESVVLRPMERYAVSTGIRIAIPDGYEGQVRPRSGLALKKGLSIPNAPGTIDSDYRGEVKVILINLGAEPVAIGKGDRIAQLVVAPVAKVHWEPCEELQETTRGTGGFGSTGIES